MQGHIWELSDVFTRKSKQYDRLRLEVTFLLLEEIRALLN